MAMNEDNHDDVLSLCDLPMDNNYNKQGGSEVSESEEDEMFEFLTDKLPKSPDEEAEIIVFCGKQIKRTSSSVGCSGHSKGEAGGLRSCSRSRRNKQQQQQHWMIGLVRVEPTMELSEIRKRQRRRRAPVPMMFPPPSSSDDDDNDNDRDHRKMGTHNWGLFLRPLRLSKPSFACISHS